MADWKNFEADKQYNTECDLEWVGRHVLNSHASYAMRNSIDHCSSLLNDVLTYFLVEMKSDGTFDDIWDLYRKRFPATCSLENNSRDEEDSGQFQLSLIS